MHRTFSTAAALALLIGLNGCSTMEPLPPVDDVDLERWRVKLLLGRNRVTPSLADRLDKDVRPHLKHPLAGLPDIINAR